MKVDICQLADVASVFNGKTPAKRDHRDTGFPVLKVKDVTGTGDFLNGFSTFVEQQYATPYAERLLCDGDIIILNAAHNASHVASKICRIPHQAVGALPTGEWMVIRANPTRVFSDFVYYWLSRKEGIAKLKFLVRGIHLYPKDVAALEIPLRPLDEQRRIVDILNHAASIRRLRDQAKAKAKELIQALFLDMFGDPVTNPQGLEVVKLGSLISNGPQNGLYKPKSDYGSGTPILRIDSFYEGRVVELSRLQRVRLDPGTVDLYSLREHDIVINRVNSRPFLGKSAIVPALLEPTVFESNMMRFSLWKEIALPEYVIQALQLRHIKQQILSRSKDAINQSSINQKDVCDLRILRPPLTAQEAFAERVDDIRATIDQMDRAAAAAEQLQAALMARLFAG